MEPPERAARGERRRQPPRAQQPQALPTHCVAHTEPHGRRPVHGRHEEEAARRTTGPAYAPPAPSPPPHHPRGAPGTDRPAGTGASRAACAAPPGTRRPRAWMLSARDCGGKDTRHSSNFRSNTARDKDFCALRCSCRSTSAGPKPSSANAALSPPSCASSAASA
eukprot:gene19805-biopygen8510